MAKKKLSTTKAKTALLNETGKRKNDERRNKTAVTPVAGERRKTKRRRQIDPTTCEREYNDAEIEFMHALDEYKRASGRMFPTCSEILEVIIGMGYRQVAAPSECFSMEDTPAEKQRDHSAIEFDTVVENEELETQAI